MGKLPNPLRAAAGLFRGSGAKTVDQAAIRAADRTAELLAKGRAIAARAQAKVDAQNAYNAAMGAKTTAIKGALTDMGFSGIRVTSKGGRTTLSMPVPVTSASKYSAMEKDYLSLQGAFGLTAKATKAKGKARLHLSFSDPTTPSAWRPPSAGKPRIRAQAPIIGATANSATAATERVQARAAQRAKGKNWVDMAGRWMAGRVTRGGRRLRGGQWEESGKTIVSAGRWMGRHPRLTAGYAAYAGYSMIASGDQPFAIG